MEIISPHSEFRGFQSLQHGYGGPAVPFFDIPLDPTNWCSCGVLALHHAITALGEPTTEREIKTLHDNLLDLTGKLRLPINEKGEFNLTAPELWRDGGIHLKPLAKLTKKTGHKPEAVTFGASNHIARFLDSHLKQGHPVILGSEPAEHWTCVIGRDAEGNFVTADSMEFPAVELIDREALLKWTGVHDGEEVECLAIRPGPSTPRSRSIVPYTSVIWESWNADTAYAKQWPNYLADMLHVFWDHDIAPNGTPAAEFFDDHGTQVAEALAEITEVPPRDIQPVLDAYRDAANFHSLVVAPGRDTACLTGLIALTLARLEDEA